MWMADLDRGRIRVHVDGGFRSGTDIFKALALGAECCWVGRPAIWGLAVSATFPRPSLTFVVLVELMWNISTMAKLVLDSCWRPCTTNFADACN